MDKLTIFTDGGSRGNPGPSACAFIVYDGNNLIYEQGFYLGVATNNIAEYTAVLKSIEWLEQDAGRRSQVAEVTFYLDSLLVVKQIKGEYKIKDAKLKAIYDQIILRIKNLKLKISFVHIPREKNTIADLLVNQTLNSEHENE